jgi:hypothetical protein
MLAMYLVIVVGLTVVLPIVSIVIELVAAPGSDPLTVTGKWFLFWGAGVRLFTAGLSQITRPQFTAENILGEKVTGANLIVQELGFANVGIGVAAIIGAWVPGWAVPIAIVPVVFLLLAGIRHIVKPNKNTKEVVATLTDLLVAVVLAVFVVWSVAAGTA